MSSGRCWSGCCLPSVVVRGSNPNERLNRETRRRTDVVGIFPDRTSIVRLVGPVLAEQYDEWAEGRHYLGLDVLTRSQTLGQADDQTPTAPDDAPVPRSSPVPELEPAA